MRVPLSYALAALMGCMIICKAIACEGSVRPRDKRRLAGLGLDDSRAPLRDTKMKVWCQFGNARSSR